MVQVRLFILFQINIHLNRGERRAKGTKLHNPFSGMYVIRTGLELPSVGA